MVHKLLPRGESKAPQNKQISGYPDEFYVQYISKGNLTREAKKVGPTKV